jgi:membrane fusion protein, multidrug efflux system
MSAMQRELERSGRLGWSRRNTVVVILVLAVIAGGVMLSKRGGAKAATANAAATAPAALELGPADVATVALTPLSRSLPISGSLTPLVQTTMRSKVAGDVLELTVREGQAVKQGEVLARIDTRYLKATLDSQQAALEKARADLALAKVNRDNSAAMLQAHYISQNAYDSAASTYAADVANEKAAEAQVALAQLSYNDAVVRAPFAGTVVKRLVQPGERVEVDGPILSLVDLSQMEFQVTAPASEIPSVKVGQLAHFKVNGFGDRSFTGKVERINPMTEAGSRSITVYLSVPNPDGALKGGMFGEGTLALDNAAPAPAVPGAALRNEAGVPFVLVLADGKLLRRPVTVGLGAAEQDGPVAVLEGLKPGEQVVLAKVDNFKDGMPAVLKTLAAPAAQQTAAAAPKN